MILIKGGENMPNIKPISDLRNYSAVLEDVTVGSPVCLEVSFTVSSLSLASSLDTSFFFVFHFSYVPPGCFSHDHKCSTNEIKLQDDFFSRTFPYFPS